MLAYVSTRDTLKYTGSVGARGSTAVLSESIVTDSIFKNRVVTNAPRAMSLSLFGEKLNWVDMDPNIPILITGNDNTYIVFRLLVESQCTYMLPRKMFWSHYMNGIEPPTTALVLNIPAGQTTKPIYYVKLVRLMSNDNICQNPMYSQDETMDDAYGTHHISHGLLRDDDQTMNDMRSCCEFVSGDPQRIGTPTHIPQRHLTLSEESYVSGQSFVVVSTQNERTGKFMFLTTFNNAIEQYTLPTLSEFQDLYPNWHVLFHKLDLISRDGRHEMVYYIDAPADMPYNENVHFRYFHNFTDVEPHSMQVIQETNNLAAGRSQIASGMAGLDPWGSEMSDHDPSSFRAPSSSGDGWSSPSVEPFMYSYPSSPSW